MSSTYILYAIEEDGVETDGKGNVVSSLMRRRDEKGTGSPLVWETREAAEQAIREIIELTGCDGYWRAVELTFSGRFPEPSREDE